MQRMEGRREGRGKYMGGIKEENQRSGKRKKVKEVKVWSMGDRSWHSKEWTERKRELRKKLRKLRNGRISSFGAKERSTKRGAKEKGRSTRGGRKKR